MPITTFDRPTTRLFGAAVVKALQQMAEEHGVSIQYHGGMMDDQELILKLKCQIKVNGEVIPTWIRDWNKYHQLAGFQQEDLGKEVTLGGRQYTIAGLKGGTRSIKVSVERLDNKKIYLASVMEVRSALGPKPRETKPRQ